MGRRGGHRGRRGGRGGGGGGTGQRPSYYPEVEKVNEKLERYYNELNIVEGEERAVFWETMRRELPNSFRFTGSKRHALMVQQRLIDHYIPEIEKVLHHGEKVDPPTPVKWYPNQLAWSMTTPKNVIRRFAPFSSFHKFLVNETLVGNISRQEIVSMIPPLLLDVRPGMTVLDMCAAPGSKTAQLIELLHAGDETRIEIVKQRQAAAALAALSGSAVDEEEAPLPDESEVGADWSDAGRPTGMLIANDVDYRRAQMLIHQTKRLNSPNLVVTNHDASLYPSIELPTKPGESAKYLKYDRILADVPCSGDGTARKNPNVWKDWDPKNALGLHLVQARILVRALQMLKPGGRMVYSTCSLNPVENEAVVAHAIERCGGVGKVRIIDVSAELPGLERRPGLNDWSVMDRTQSVRKSWDEVQQAIAAGQDVGRVIEEMFPPPAPATEDERIPLERCVRVYPHFMDTGGFFITALEKVSEFRALPEMRANRVKVDTGAAAAVATPAATAAATADPSPTTKRPAEDDVEASVETKKVKTDVDGETGAEVEAEAEVETKPEPGVETKTETSTPAPAEVSTPVTATTTTTTTVAPTETRRKNTGLPFEEPFVYLRPDHEVLDSIFSFYDICPTFPRDRFMVRNGLGEPVKGIYYTSGLIRDILTANESKGVKFVHSGVKMFQKQDVQGRTEVCPWRIQAEGLTILDPWVRESRLVELHEREPFKRLLKELFPRVGNGDEGWTGLGHISEKVRDIGMGCCILRIDLPAGDDGPAEKAVLPLWRSINSVNLMLPKDERRAMLVRLYGDTSELVDCSRHLRERAAQQSSEAQDGEAAAEEDRMEVDPEVEDEQVDVKPDVEQDEIDFKPEVEQDHIDVKPNLIDAQAAAGDENVKPESV